MLCLPLIILGGRYNEFFNMIWRSTDIWKVRGFLTLFIPQLKIKISNDHYGTNIQILIPLISSLLNHFHIKSCTLLHQTVNEVQEHSLHMAKKAFICIGLEIIQQKHFQQDNILMGCCNLLIKNLKLNIKSWNAILQRIFYPQKDFSKL